MATYYWVGGNGTWDGSSTANWSNASGGASGFGPPSAADTVVFDSASGTGTCTTASGSACAVATLNSSTLGLTLGANHTMSGTFTLTLGNLSLINYSLTCSIFSSNNTNTRSIAFGTGNITVTAGNNTVWNVQNATNFSYTGTPNVNFSYSGSVGVRAIVQGSLGGSTESNSVSFNITAGTDQVAVYNYMLNLDLTGFSGTLVSTAAKNIYGNFIVSTTATIASGASGTAFVKTSGTQQITTNGKTLDFPINFNGVGGTFQLQDNMTVGDTRTVTLTNGALDLNNLTLSCGLFSSSNSNSRSIAFGTGNITLTGNAATVWSTLTVTNFAYTGTPNVNLTYAGSTGTRAIVTGSTGLTQVLNFNITGGSDTVNFSSTNSVLQNLIFSGFTGTLTNTNKYVTGNVTFSAGMTLAAGANSLIFYSTSSTQNLTTNGLALDFPITIGASTQAPVVVCQDALTQGSTRAFTLTNGTVQLKAGVTSTVGSFATSGTTQKYLQSTTAGSQATLSDASGTNSLSYTTIQDIFATGGATWNAYYASGNIDGGNNTNWNFGGTPSYDAEYGYKLRSFTEQGRF